jgi:hypothetical protein
VVPRSAAACSTCRLLPGGGSGHRWYEGHQASREDEIHATIAGLIAFAFAVPLHQRYQMTVRNRAMRAPTADAAGPDAD